MKNLRFSTELVSAIRNCGLDYHMITPSERQLYDPYGLIQANISKHCQNMSGQQCPLTVNFGSSDTWLKWYQQSFIPRFEDPVHSLYWDYNRSYSSKYGNQGGSVYLPDAVPSIARYYAKIRSRKHPILNRGLKALTRRIREVTSRVGYLANYPPDGDHVNGTWAGIPTGLIKGGYKAETESCSPHLTHLLPSVIGFRKARNGLRCIFQDATSNVRATGAVASAVLNWLRMYLPEYFGAWCHPMLVVNPIATQHIGRGGLAIEYDYEKCDQHFTKKVTINYVLPVIAAIIGSQSGEFISFAALAEEYFDTSLYLGDVMITGTHSLFSGQTITQLFETIFDIVLQLGLCEEFGFTDTLHLAVGDDQALLLPNRYSSVVEDVKDAGIEASNAAGLIMNPDKTHISVGYVNFCKRLFYPRGVRDNGLCIGAYPSILTLNAIINPEFSSSSLGESLLATMQRLDNLYGSPEYVPMVQAIGSRIDKGVCYSEYDLTRTNRKDWWQRVYHETWNPESSRSFRLLQSFNLI